MYKKRYKYLLFFVKKFYFLPIILGIVFLIGIFIFYKFFLITPTYIYVRVKVSQGFWWANTAKPNTWIANAIKTGDKTKDILGKPEAEVIGVRQYPAWINGQYDVDITLKLKVTQNNKNRIFTFNRSPVLIGSPIEIEFPKVNITGTITDIEEKPFKDKYIDKIVLLINQGGYSKDFPYRYDAIHIGDKYFDGKEYVFEILDKKLEENIWSIANLLEGNSYEQHITTTQNIVVKAKIRVREVNNELYYGGDYKVIPNASIPISTANFFFEEFFIRKIE